jgi:GNAT superfamily N-acetyltransferase
VQFRTLDELTPSMEIERNLLHLAAFGGVFPRSSIELYRRRSDGFADYVGLFAVERGRLVGQMFVLRIPFTFAEGTERVTGIAAVGTRPDRGRAGVARRLLTEVHRREREAGIRYTTLWTNRSWGAHRLYEKLGYRDVYSSPWAVHGPSTRRLGRSRGVRPARRSDVLSVERLHTTQARGRLGFVERPREVLRIGLAAHDFELGPDLIVCRSGRKLQGYAHLEATRNRVLCGELVAVSPAARRSLVREVERRAGKRPFAFQHTVVTDAAALFRGRGYAFVPQGWYVFMAGSLARTWSSREAIARLGTRDPRFLCLAWDRF